MEMVSLARIICDNTGIDEVPTSPFEYRPRGLGYTKCEEIPSFDLSPWKEDGGWMVPNDEMSQALAAILLPILTVIPGSFLQ